MLFAFGSNGNGQLALGNEDDTHVPTPCVVPSDCPTVAPKSIRAGGNHTFLLFPNGRLFATGLNEHGQCGISPSVASSFKSFHEVPAPPGDPGSGWDFVAAGWEFSVLVSSSGRAYSCGRGSRGELGLGEKSTASTPTEIHGLPRGRVASLACGMAHAIIVFDEAGAFGWGAGRKGQLGELSEKFISTPRKVDLDFPPAKIVCGREFSFVVSADGDRHAVLGGERYGIAGTSPSQGSLKGWKQVGASWGGVNVLLETGKIVSWGRNDKGQLAPAGLGSVERIAIGSEHGVAVTRSDLGVRAVSWGWGEHGNCGRPREEGGGDVIGDVAEVAVPGRLVDVGAGCATSWLWVET